MISLRRVRTADVVHPNFRSVKRIALNLTLLKKKRDKQLEASSDNKWDSSIWKEAKTQLLIESNNKCAYCETPTRVVAYGDVEHFRPKSIYWWLAYSYENYLASCGACNQEYKKDFFPIKNKMHQLKGPTVTADMADKQLKLIAPLMTVDPVDDTAGKPLSRFIDEIHKEFSLIVNPYFDDPTVYFAYQPILANKEVVVIPTLAKHKPIVEACEKYFGINRKELLDLRFQQYCTYMTYRHTLQSGSLEAQTKQMIQNRLTEMQADFSAYAGMIRYLQTQSLTQLPWDFNLVI